MRSAKIQLFGGVGVVFTCLAFWAIGSSLSAQATIASPWLAPGNPTVEKISEVDLKQPLPKSIVSNRDCQTREVITRPQRFAAPIQSKISHQSCVVDTGYGAVENNGYLQRAGSSISGELRTGRGDKALMIPVPKSSTGIRLGGGSYGNYFFFYDNLEEHLSSTAIYNGEVYHRLPLEYSEMLKNGNGDLLAPDSSTMSFSINGDWAVVDIPFLAMVRINIKTREILPFMYGSNPFNAVGPAYKTAVSQDGRYAIVSSKSFEIFKLYDLSTCGVVPKIITGKVQCESKDLLPFMRQQIPGFTSVASMRFRTNYALDLYANSIENNVTKLTRYLVAAAGQQKVGFQYLAMGDSFASGEGAYRYKAATDTTENMCHLSQRSYPYLISSVLNYGQYESVACSGAVMDDVWNNSKEYRKENSQSKGLFEDIYDEQIYMSFLTGHRAQNEFNKQHSANIITLSIGGNNIGFGDIILRCMDTDTCYNNYEDRLMLADLINKQFDPLTKTYGEVKASTDPRSKIYIIGYPQLADTEGTCDMNVHMNKDERVFAKQLISHLNGVIKKAAEYSGVFYVDVEDAFAGHKMCEARNSWDVAVNGLTAGNDQIDLPFLHGPIGNESFHPNALGHDLLKIKILEKTNNFTAQMPTPNPSAKATELDSNTPLLQAPKSNKTIRNLKYLTGTDGGVIRAGTFWAYKATGLDEVFAVGAEIKAWLHSEPLSLGTYSLGPEGSVGIEANIPSSVTPGFHTLHLYGKNSSGEDIDAFKTVYVEGLALCSSGQDNDKDKLDDACDGFIDQPPVVVAPPIQPITSLPVLATTPSSAEVMNLEDTQDSDDTQSTSANSQETATPQTTTQPVVLASVNQAQPNQPQQATANDLNQPAVLGARDEKQELPATITSIQARQGIKSSDLWAHWPKALVALIVLAVFLALILAF